MATATSALGASVVTIHLPWTDPVAQGGTVEVYADLSASDGATLVAVDSTSAERAELRGAGITRASPRSLALPPEIAVHLKPGGARIALIGIHRTLLVGDHVPLILTLERANGEQERVAISAEVRHASAADEEAHEHHHAR